MTVILASGSPRRKEILASIGLDFEAIPSDVDETVRSNEPVQDLVKRLAIEKARSIASIHPMRLVIAADTLVELDGEILGKPADESEAVAMLSRIEGRSHTVHTAIALVRVDPSHESCRLETTNVAMMPMTRREIEWYVRTGEPLDKAGSYAIQGLGAMFVQSIEGNYTNVVGLPVPLLVDMMKAAGAPDLLSGKGSHESAGGGASG